MKTLMVALLAFFALTLVAAAAPSRDCLSQAQAAKVYPGKYLKYREIGAVRCWFAGRTPSRCSRLPVLVQSRVVLARHHQERSECRPRRWSGAGPVSRTRF